MKPISKEIHKKLSPNDLGLTGSHQDGILVPKKKDILSFFPYFDHETLNPRVRIPFYDDFESKWDLNFIYYNNRFFGGTRNEYRLTRLTAFFRQYRLQVGDEIILILDHDDNYYIRYRREHELYTYKDGVLKIKSGWTVFNYEGDY